LESGWNGGGGGEEIRKRGASTEMEHRDRDYWPGRGGHEYQFITLEGEFNEPGETRRFRNAQGCGSGAEAEKNFVCGGKREPTVC